MGDFFPLFDLVVFESAVDVVSESPGETEEPEGTFFGGFRRYSRESEFGGRTGLWFGLTLLLCLVLTLRNGIAVGICTRANEKSAKACGVEQIGAYHLYMHASKHWGNDESGRRGWHVA